jgi:hypothetical protein
MSAFLAFIGGAAGEYNQMTEEQRLAKAEEIKRTAEADAAKQAQKSEFDYWKKQQDYTANQNQTEAKAEAQRKNQARQDAIMRSTPELYFRNQNDPNNLHFFSQIGDMPTIDSIPRPKEGLSFTDATALAKQQNPFVSGAGYLYVPEPIDEAGTKYKIVMKELKDDDKVFANQSAAQSAATSLNNYYTTGGLENFVAVVESTEKGWVVKTQEKPKPETPKAPVDTKTGIPLDTNYYYSNSPKFGPETGKTAQQRGGQLVPLRKNLPMSGPEMANMKEGEDYLVIRTSPMGVEGDVDIAEANMKNFFEDFPPDVVKRITARKDDVPSAYETMRLQFRNAVSTWNSATAEKTDSGITYRPISESFSELEDYAKLDPAFRTILSSSPSPAEVEAIVADTEIPINEPVTLTDDGGGKIQLRPTLAAAFAVLDPEDNRLKYTPEFQERAQFIAQNGRESLGLVYDLLDGAVLNGENVPDASREALADLTQNITLMKDLDFVTVRGGRGTYQMPNIVSKRAELIRNNLSTFPTHADRVVALELSVPSLTAKSAVAKTLVSSSSGPDSLYASVTGNKDYDKIAPRINNANKVIQTANTLETLVGELGGDVGLPSELQAVKAGASYLLDSILPTLSAGDNAKFSTEQLRNSVRQEYENALKQTDQQTQLNALVRLNIRVMSYAYASMMDENGRLSDQDREQADIAIGAQGWTANPTAVLATSRALRERSQYRLAVDTGYTSNNPRRVVAAHLYSTLSGGQVDPVVEVLRRAGVSGTGRLAQGADVDQAEQQKKLQLLYGTQSSQPSPSPVTPTMPRIDKF